MNDHELDEMLDRWQAPLPRETVRENLRAGFAAARTRAGLLSRMADAMPGIRISRFAVATIVAVSLFFALVQMSPQTVRMASPGFRIPYYVEFQFTRYEDDGRAPYRSRITSFPYGGHEIIMSATETGGSFLNAFRGIAGSIRTQFILAMPSFILRKGPPMSEPGWFAGFVKSGCAEGRTVIGRESVAGYETTVVQSASPVHRVTIWMAPELGCFALKLTDEVQEPNGTYRLKVGKEAVKVTMNR